MELECGAVVGEFVLSAQLWKKSRGSHASIDGGKSVCSELRTRGSEAGTGIVLEGGLEEDMGTSLGRDCF